MMRVAPATKCLDVRSWRIRAFDPRLHAQLRQHDDETALIRVYIEERLEPSDRLVRTYCDIVPFLLPAPGTVWYVRIRASPALKLHDTSHMEWVVTAAKSTAATSSVVIASQPLLDSAMDDCAVLRVAASTFEGPAVIGIRLVDRRPSGVFTAASPQRPSARASAILLELEGPIVALPV